MIVGIVGTGLIGGSFLKALRSAGHSVFAVDKKTTGMVAARLTPETLAMCDAVIIALYPGDVVEYIKENARCFKRGAVVLDVAGVKRAVAEAYGIAKAHGFTFVGAHPMAGKECWGSAAADAHLFCGATLILTPADATPPEAVERIKKLAADAGFSAIKYTDPTTHDRIIAYTSQLAHVVSAAYVGSETLAERHGFTAGSFLDMTRVAQLNEDMWAELMMKNADMLSGEIDGLMHRLDAYKSALDRGDEAQLLALLRTARQRKETL